jgi:uncharacterized membrane protein YbhN (UPF0104 family)
MNPAQPSRKPKLSTLIRWGGTLLSTLLFIWLISRQQWDVVFEKATGVAWWAVAATIGLYIVSYGFNTLRWCILLWSQNVQVSYFRSFQIAWAGNFASNFLPSTIGGDGFRMLAIYPSTGSKTLAIGSVALDRVINMAAMACLLPLPLMIFGTKLTSLVAIIIPAPIQKLVERYFPKIAAAFRTWATRPMAFVGAFLAAWPSNLTPMLATYVIARQLGIQVSYMDVVAVQTVAYFLSVLPISVNGYGLREMVYTTLYASLGATIEQASALALLSRLLMVMATLPGGLWLTNAAMGNLEES